MSSKSLIHGTSLIDANPPPTNQTLVPPNPLYRNPTNPGNNSAQELMSETRNNVAGAIGAANDIIEKGRSTLASYERAPFARLLPPKTRETVRLETEAGQALLEKPKSQNPVSSFLESVLKPKPIVDSISEEEKYGNNGDKFIGVGRALVNGFEGLSNFLNAVVEVSVDIRTGGVFFFFASCYVVG